MSGAIPPLPQYAFVAWCSGKAQGQLYLYQSEKQLSCACVRTLSYSFCNYKVRPICNLTWLTTHKLSYSGHLPCSRHFTHTHAVVRQNFGSLRQKYARYKEGFYLGAVTFWSTKRESGQIWGEGVEIRNLNSWPKHQEDQNLRLETFGYLHRKKTSSKC